MNVTLDGSIIKSESDLHAALSRQLDFGPFYGNNLAALWDRLTTDIPRPIHLTWEHATECRGALGENLFQKVCVVFRDVEQHDQQLKLADRFVFTLKQ